MNEKTGQDEKNPTKQVIYMCPGHNAPLKKYISYFPMFDLKHLNDYDPLKDLNSFVVVLCHSMGILAAMDFLSANIDKKQVFVVAMDPQSYNEQPNTNSNTNSNVYVFARQGRSDVQSNNLILYDEQTHYPYQIKSVRDKIVKLIQKLITGL